MGKTCTGSMADTLGVDNPFRYRGYVYDEETGLYYLRSRYYEPEWGRFLNADSFLGKAGGILSHNTLAYCNNNPIYRSDTTGFEPIPWSEDNWANVVDLSHEGAVNINRGWYAGDNKGKEKATLHLLTDDGKKVISIEVELDPIGDTYHIDTRLLSSKHGVEGMKEAAGKNWGKHTYVEAFLEMSNGTLAACSVDIYFHSKSKKNDDGSYKFLSSGSGHFDVYMKDSYPQGSQASQFHRVAGNAFMTAKKMVNKVKPPIHRGRFGGGGVIAVPY